jgi:hypothetical protein
MGGEILCQQDDLWNGEDVIVPCSVDVLVEEFGFLTPSRPENGTAGNERYGDGTWGFKSPFAHKCDESGHGLHMSRVGYRFPGRWPGCFVWLRQ